jgi:hypothetical protein
MKCSAFTKSTALFSIICFDSIRSRASSQLISALVSSLFVALIKTFNLILVSRAESQDSIACLGDLLYYGGVEWLNISDFLGKIKKGLELHAMCFVFKSAVVFLCKERLRQKKKLMVS